MATDDNYQTHFEEYLEKQVNMIDENLHPQHSKRVTSFLDEYSEQLAKSTLRTYARELRFLFEASYEYDYSEKVKEWETDEWIDLIRWSISDRGAGDGTKRNTVYAVRKFINYLSSSEADPDEIEAPTIKRDQIDPKSVLNIDDIIELIETSNHIRDKAIIAVMYEAALRRTALVQLDIGNYIGRDDNEISRIKIPDKEGVKTGKYGERPLSWAKGYLDNWLTQHPDKGDQEAPLFCSIRNRDEGKRLTGHSIYTMLKRTAKRSNIDSEKVHPHNFRHSRVTELRENANITKSNIETILGWSESTAMHARYSHADKTEEAKAAAKNLGVEIPEDKEDQTFEICPRCGYEDLVGATYCPKCTLRIDDQKPVWWTIYETVVDEEDPLYKKYERSPTHIPVIDQMQIEEIDHIYHVYLMAEMLMYKNMPAADLDDTKYESVTQFETEENATKAMEIIREKIKPRMVSIHNTETLELKEGSIDLDNIEKIAEEEQSKEE